VVISRYEIQSLSHLHLAHMNHRIATETSQQGQVPARSPLGGESQGRGKNLYHTVVSDDSVCEDDNVNELPQSGGVKSDHSN
jgi:hypothetical protein